MVGMNVRNHVVFYYNSGGFIVKKSKKIILAIACVVIVAVLAFAKISGGSLSTAMAQELLSRLNAKPAEAKVKSELPIGLLFRR